MIIIMILIHDNDLDEVHGEGELLVVQHPIIVSVRQAPDLAQHLVRQLGLHHLLLRRPA